ncbi:Crp/Fnr family transcriptional regulator [Bacillus sp. REN16]|uniref:Crp/Fnr family transcriptional regulator n=1 Tax=Bacillus sp. REN16 TaxID=2887296 RepID=UPI001E31326C|nr:Crp/Fnr family transcriptional regulator [Bacillus sp. REN16]MCC3359175.1 Crp/Fnr family transcriptional regulator [Bacillus sp. REN16]
MLKNNLFFENQFTDFKPLLLEIGERYLLEKGSVITNNIEPLYLYYIEKGIFRLSVNHIEGVSKTICFHGEGSICPYSLSRPINGTFQIDVDFFAITAITDIDTIRIRPKDFHQALKENTDLGIAMLDYVIMHSNLFMHETLTLSYDSAFVKTCNIVYIYTHYLNKMGINLTQAEIGEIIGETRLEVARSLKKLRDDGIIKTSRNCLEVLNPEALKLNCSPDFV